MACVNVVPLTAGCGFQIGPIHTFMECPAFTEIRDEGFRQIKSVYPAIPKIGREEKMNFLFCDRTPRKVSSRAYRFLMEVFQHRDDVCLSAELTNARGRTSVFGFQ